VDLLFLIIVGVPLLAFVSALGATALATRRVPQLRRLGIDARAEWPRVSIVVPACDEEAGVEGALRSLLAQRYPDVQIVAVDDRSTDRTGDLMDRLAAEDERLAVVHIEALPEGWLGKLNALHRGVAESDGEWLLFADADAHLGEDTLKKCISHADARGVDFLSVLPHIGSAGFWGDTVFNAVTSMFCLGVRPWRIKEPRSSAIGATGAFMLVRRAAFDRTPGFPWLKLEVADDFGLCLMLKEHGGRCDMLLARDEVRIAWYASLAEISTKMQKNFFAITGRFSPPRIVGQAALIGWLGLYPLAALLPVAPRGAAWLHGLLAATAVVQLLATLAASRWTARPSAPSFLPCVGFVLLSWMMLRAAIVGWQKGGIEWRGVLYPTSLLRDRQRVKV
jgi:hypothetical protein